MNNDKRNVIDKYKGAPIDDIVHDLDARAHTLEIAVDNVERDFNMGTIVRSANAFGVRRDHIIGRRQWNKRGAMMTDKYLHLCYYASVDDFIAVIGDKTLIAIDNVQGSQPLNQTMLPEQAVLLFGAEHSGIRPELLERAQAIAAIEQFGSTRSINVGVAAGIAMYEWLRRCKLNLLEK